MAEADFQHYAALNWTVHYTSQHSERAKGSRKAAQRLYSTASSQQSSWFSFYCGSKYLKDSGPTELEIASMLGLIYVVEALSNEGADVNAPGRRYANALQAASIHGYTQVVQILLDKGADVNAQGGHYGNALYAASEGGYGQVVQMLLDKGANIDT